MNNAKTYSIGYDKKPRKRKTEKIAPSVSGVCRMDAETKRCPRNRKGQKKVSSPVHVADGILKTTFLPKFRQSELTEVSHRSTELERDFFESLSKLTLHYSIESLDTQKFGFPYNINLALSDTKKQLKKTVSGFDDLRLLKEGNKTYLVTEERYNTGGTLFYIPVFPLFKMLHDKKYRKTAHLMLSVFSYLYHIVDIPYHTQENSFLYWEYDMLKDWILEDIYSNADEEEEEEDERLAEISVATWVGKNIEQKIGHENNLTFFDDRIKKFRPKDQLEEDCLVLARKALSLYRTYPQENIFRHASSMLDETEEEISEEIIPMEKYISFYADNKGYLASTLFDTVNTEFQEYGEIQEPVILKYFDGRDILTADLSFEIRLFDLLHDTIDLLNLYRTLGNENN